MPDVYAVFHKQLGDLVLLQPALAKLGRNHGGAVRLLTRGGHAPLVGLMEGVRMVRGMPLKPLPRLYAFDPFRKTAWRSLLAPAREKICLLPEARERQWFAGLVFSRVCVPELGAEYIAEYFWRHTPGRADAQFEPPRLLMPPESWRPAAAPARPYILLNPTAGWRQKSWLPARWAELIREIFGQAPPRILITSGFLQWQKDHARETHAAIGAQNALLAGGLSLREFLWLCSRAEAVLTVDGAASHLAAAFGVPAFTLFGPTPPVHWHRPGPIARCVRAPASHDGRHRMKNLDVPTAAAAARPWLDAIRAAGLATLRG